jgi:hypothetical protein
MPSTTRRTLARSLACLAAPLAAMLAACDAEPERTPTPESPAFAAPIQPRSTVRALPTDTLSEAARIVRLVPEPDGRSVAVVFADTSSGVSSGLALNELGEDRMELLWPDSVTNVWWPSDHSVAFTTETGRGIRVVVDVHAESLTVMERLDDSVAVPPIAPADESEVRARATTYIDSVFAQAEGRATRGELTYAVARLVPVDAVVGPPEQLPADAAGWTDGGVLVYAKGLTIWSAQPTTRGLAWRSSANSLAFNE